MQDRWGSGVVKVVEAEVHQRVLHSHGRNEHHDVQQPPLPLPVPVPQAPYCVDAEAPVVVRPESPPRWWRVSPRLKVGAHRMPTAGGTHTPQGNTRDTAPEPEATGDDREYDDDTVAKLPLPPAAVPRPR